MNRRSRRPHAIARTTGSMLLIALAGCSTPDATGQRPATPRPGVSQPVGPGSAPPEAQALLASCPEDVWPAGGAGAEAVHLGTYEGMSVFAISGSTDAIVAVGKLGPDEPAGCSVQQAITDVEPVVGSFWPQAGAVQAVLLRPVECDPAFCPATLLIRNGERAQGALGAWPWPEECNHSLRLTRLRWFTGQDSLQITCRQSTGAGYREIVTILHVLAPGLVPVLTLETGTAEYASQEERETPGFCERRPVGWVRLVEQGERPRVQVFDPARGQPGTDGKGTGLLADFRFDPATGRFEQVSPGTLQDYDARAWCQKE